MRVPKFNGIRKRALYCAPIELCPPETRVSNLPAHVGILLTNLGTPDQPTVSAVRRYLAQFLWDPRVIEFPRALWWLILHGYVLRVRPQSTTAAYRTVWTDEGSPLLVGPKTPGPCTIPGLPRRRAWVGVRHRDALRQPQHRLGA